MKVGETSRTLSFHLSNFEKFLKSKIRYAHETGGPKSWIDLRKASLLDPPNSFKFCTQSYKTGSY